MKHVSRPPSGPDSPRGTNLSRRQFLAGTGMIAAGVSLAPRHVLGGARHVPPSEQVTVGYIGCGTQGLRQLMPLLQRTDARVVAVCDPNRKSDDYPEWGRHEVNQKVRKFLDDAAWAKDARGGVCGREVGELMVNRHYKRQPGSATKACRAYSDFRELLEKEQGLDAVYIMTPEHLHGVVAARAMRHGKHVITHKPVANVLNEVRVVRDIARETGVATHLFCAAGVTTSPAIREWIESGAIGPVREVHNWSTRPFWPQGMTSVPAENPPVPEGLDWDLWLGPAAPRPFHPAYTHAVFRGWYDFGTGALGDMGHYSFHQIFEILQLDSPVSVQAARSQFWEIENYTWHKQVNRVSFPRASMITWEFGPGPDRPPVTLHWYDGGLRPPVPNELETDGQEMPDEGMLFIGEKGKILAEFTAGRPRLIPQTRMSGFVEPPQRYPRPVAELDQFFGACRGTGESDASFERAYPFAEAILLGTIALRVDKKLRWDTAKFEFANSSEANELKVRKNRPGWELT
jgi:predicted dehydrogenase